MNALRYYDLGYTEVFVFENYLINQIKEGHTVKVNHAKVLRAMIEKHYPDREMVYIGNRVNSYSVDPLVYLQVSKIKNLSALCIVATSDLKRNTAFYEKQFCLKPFEIFTSMNDALEWSSKQLLLLNKKL
jgi:hypothetical protein